MLWNLPLESLGHAGNQKYRKELDTMNINEYRLAAIRKLIDMARQSNVEPVRDSYLKFAKEIALDDYFTDPLEWFGYLLECNLREFVQSRTGKLIENQVAIETDLDASIQCLQFFVGGYLLPLLNTENMKKVFTSSLKDHFSYREGEKSYYFTFRITKIPSEGNIKIKIARKEK